MRKLTIAVLLLSLCANTTKGQKKQDTSGTDTRKVHLSLAPGISIVQTENSKEVKKASINVFFGYSKGIDGFEVAGLGNITNGDVRYFQAAGLTNVVHGNLNGFQGAGLINVVTKKTKGFQGAGLINICADSVNGMQAAGLINVCGKQTTGMQAAGLFNISPSINGMQAAGLFNVAKTCKGNQIAGLFNVAKNVKGSQIGVFNIADTCNGIAVGFFSFVRSGYHKVEISADEVFYTNLAFRTGTTKFHNIFSVGVTPQKKQNQLWTFGYGLGTSFKLSNKLLLDVDLSANQIQKVNVPLWGSEDSLTINKRNQRLNLNNKVYVGVEWQVAKKISIGAGPVFNLMLADERNADYTNVFSKLQTNYWYSQKVSDHLHMNVWVGARLAVRFL